jgi:hypothetical protein
MDIAEQLMDLEQIKQLKARYFRHIDLKNWDAFEELFTEDAILDVSGDVDENDKLPDGQHLPGGLCKGKQAIGKLVSGVLHPVASAHLGSMPEIELLSSTSATGIWAMVDHLIWPDGAPLKTLDGYGHYIEEYEKVAGVWKFKRMKLTRLWVDITPGA